LAYGLHTSSHSGWQFGIRCSGSQNYWIDCECGGIRFGDFAPSIKAAGEEFVDPRRAGWFWIPESPLYIRTDGGTIGIPGPGGLRIPIKHYWYFN
jgi:hypothetical protein